MDLVDAETGDGRGLPGLFVVQGNVIGRKRKPIRGLNSIRYGLRSLRWKGRLTVDLAMVWARAIPRQELDRVILEQLRKRAAGIEQALSAMADDVYGVCEECGESIHPDRPAVLPDTTRCIRCARVCERE